MKPKTKVPAWQKKRDIAREAWITRFTGYFGNPLRLDAYRRGEINFELLYRSSIRHVEDQLNEAGRYAPEADPRDDWPKGYPNG